MSPATKITNIRLNLREKELVITEKTESPLDKLVERLEEALKNKGKKNLPTIPYNLMEAVSAPIYKRLLIDFPDLVAGEGMGAQGNIDPGEAVMAIRKQVNDEDLCLSIYRRFASTDLEQDKGLRAQLMGVILEEVGNLLN